MTDGNRPDEDLANGATLDQDAMSSSSESTPKSSSARGRASPSSKPRQRSSASSSSSSQQPSSGAEVGTESNRETSAGAPNPDGRDRTDGDEDSERITMVDGEVRASEPAALRSSSIRPVPDWHPPRSIPRVPTPMVVVYSGDSRRPRPKRDVDDAPSRPSNVSLEVLGFREPFGPAEDLAETSGDRSAMPGPPGDTGGVEPPSSSPARNVLSGPRERIVSAGPAAQAAALGALRWFAQSRLGPATLVALISAVIITVLLVDRAAQPEAVPRAERAVQGAHKPMEAPIATALAPASTARTDPHPAAEAHPEKPAVLESSPGNDKTRSVTIDVVPADAKVVYRGLKRPGPPYVVDVPAGKRIALEVARKGYVTRRVVVDGSESTLTVALIEQPREAHDLAKADSEQLPEDSMDEPASDNVYEQ